MSDQLEGFEKEEIRPDQVGAMPAAPNGQVPAAKPGTAMEVVDFGEDAAGGLENLGLDEQLTPFLRMLQGLSPELNPSKAEYIPGAQMGMIFNTASLDLYPGKEGVDVVLCAREHCFGQWIPRDQGSGFRGNLPPDDSLVRETVGRMAKKYGASAKFKLPRYRDGRWTDDPPRTRDTDEAVELVESGQLYVLYGPPGGLDANTAQRALISMTSTGMPVYQSVITRHNSWKWLQPDGRMLPAPLWTYRWRLTTSTAKNNKGEYFVWNLSLAPPAQTYREARMLPNDQLYVAGKEFNRLFREGAVKADYEQQAATSREPGDDIPF